MTEALSPTEQSPFESRQTARLDGIPEFYKTKHERMACELALKMDDAEAIFRAYDYLWYLRLQSGRDKWFDGKRSRETIFLVNRAYGSTFPVSLPVGEGRTVGFTDWTHALGAAAISRPGPRPVSTESASR